MVKKLTVFGCLLCFLFISGPLTGCGQQSPNSGVVDYTKASTDLENVASGLQSTGGNTSQGLASSGISAEGFIITSLSNQRAGLSTQSIPAGWDPAKTISFESTYTWTTPTGTVVTEEAEIYGRYLDAGGNQLGFDFYDLFTWEGASLTFLANKQQIISSFSSLYYNGYFNALVGLPANFIFPYTMNVTAEGGITFLAPPVSTFEILSFNLTVTVAATNTAAGSMNWGYQVEGSSYAYYYGAVNINFLNLGVNPSAMTGDVYQDLTDNGIKDGNKVGTISFEESGRVKITLDNGTIVYAGMF